MVAHAVVVLFIAFIVYTAWPGSSLFSWHPTLMTLAFVGCMFEGLLAFNPESSLFFGAARQTKVLFHQVCQICAVVLSLAGFAVIYYNKTLNDKPHFTTWHGFFGIITIIVSSLQSFGGDLVRYAGLRAFLKIKSSLAVLKVYHATSGLITFTLVTVTFVCAFYSSWFTSHVDGLLWYPCMASLSFMSMIVMNRVVGEYLPRTRVNKSGQRQAQVSSTEQKAKVSSKKKKSD